jgi:hypothetical protein
MNRIVRIEPVGERVIDRSSSVTLLSSASLKSAHHDQLLVSLGEENGNKTYQIALTHQTLSRALSAASLSTPSAYKSWNGQSTSISLVPPSWESISSAAIVPMSSHALRCPGLGTLRSSLQFNKFKVIVEWEAERKKSNITWLTHAEQVCP